MEGLTTARTEPPAYPFAAVASMEAAKEALLLLAVEPRLKGVVIAAGPGTGKSVLTRAMKPLLCAGDSLPFVELPLHATHESLVGSLDLERAVRHAEAVYSPGLLARASGGFLLVDLPDRLDRAAAALIAQALDRGEVLVEREGVSRRAPTRFCLLATCCGSREDISPALLDAAGLHVIESGCVPPAGRVALLRSAEAFLRTPEAFARQYAEETARIARTIADARDRLPSIEPAPGDLRFLCSASAELEVEGHRAESFCAYLIRARAALLGRTSIIGEDLEAAVRFVLEPRAKARSSPAPPSAPEVRRQAAGASGAFTDPPRLEDAGVIDCPAPAGALRHAGPAEGQTGGRGRSNRGAGWNGVRGRYVRSVPGPAPGGRVALDATLRAAAPLQRWRRQSRPEAGSGIVIGPEDLRFMQFRKRNGILVVFAVDVSGSMAMNRINLAKGALSRLFREAYIERDNVSLVAFRGRGAEVLLPPGRGMERARRAVEGLRTGGGTPLAAGLRTALDVVRRERSRGSSGALLVLFTDGAANVPIVPANDPWEEIEGIAKTLRCEGVASVVVDTTPRYLATGRPRLLAGYLGGRHLILPSPDQDMLHGALAETANGVRGKR